MDIDDYNEMHGDTWVDMRLENELKEFREEIRQLCKDYAKDAFETLNEFNSKGS